MLTTTPYEEAAGFIPDRYYAQGELATLWMLREFGRLFYTCEEAARDENAEALALLIEAREIATMPSSAGRPAPGIIVELNPAGIRRIEAASPEADIERIVRSNGGAISVLSLFKAMQAEGRHEGPDADEALEGLVDRDRLHSTGEGLDAIVTTPQPTCKYESLGAEIAEQGERLYEANKDLLDAMRPVSPEEMR